MSRALRRAAFRILIGAGCLALWELAYRLGMINPIIFSAPSLIIKAAAKNGIDFLNALKLTAFEIVIATLVAWSVGIAIGVVAGSWRLIGRISAPLLSGIIAVPLVILYPVLVAWCGIGPESKIVFGILLGIFPIALNTMIGVQILDPGYARMATAMGASRLQLITRVMMPLALPAVVSGLRLGTSLIIAGIVLSEMLAATDGLGYWISYYRALFDSGQVYLGVILCLVVAAAANGVLSLLERRYGRWHSRQQENT